MNNLNMSYKLPSELPPQIERFRTQIESALKPYIEIKPRKDNNLNWWQSKFGGLPYLPQNFEYPRTTEGEYLYLLAQINFTEVPNLENFPQQGILQIYIADNGLYGCNLENMTDQSSFRVLYFPEPDLKIEKIITDFSFLPDSDALPLDSADAFALEFKPKIQPITVVDYKFESIFAPYFEDREQYYQFWEQYDDIFFTNSRHQLGGYPHFTQDDPRYFYSAEEEKYNLLLQIDSDLNLDIMWGDVGVGNFFIQDSALKQLDFSNVLYNYDCH